MGGGCSNARHTASDSSGADHRQYRRISYRWFVRYLFSLPLGICSWRFARHRAAAHCRRCRKRLAKRLAWQQQTWCLLHGRVPLCAKAALQLSDEQGILS